MHAEDSFIYCVYNYKDIRCGMITQLWDISSSAAIRYTLYNPNAALRRPLSVCLF